MTRRQQPSDLLSIADAAALLGVKVRTLRLWANEGRLPFERGPLGRRLFYHPDIERLRAARIGERPPAVVLYARVSSHRQEKEGDLTRQRQRLRTAMADREIAGDFADIASGLSEKRSGLRRALITCAQPAVGELVITHRERLARFGVGPLETLLASLGVKLTVIGEDAVLGASPESDLVRDLLAIVTCFSGRLHGLRSAQARTARAMLRAALR
jgi:excisionase family DNA binding protein